MTSKQKTNLISVIVMAVLFLPLWICLLGWWGIYLDLFWAILRSAADWRKST